MLKDVGRALALTLLIGAAACSAQPPFKGVDLNATPAPDFQLTDQSGNNVSLSNLRGKIVVLSFLYTRCQDVCPLIAFKMSQAYSELGNDAQQIKFVVISVSPEEDN